MTISFKTLKKKCYGYLNAITDDIISITKVFCAKIAANIVKIGQRIKDVKLIVGCSITVY